MRHNDAYTDTTLHTTALYSDKKNSLHYLYEYDYSERDDLDEFITFQLKDNYWYISLLDSEQLQICKKNSTEKRFNYVLKREVLPYLHLKADKVWKDSSIYNFDVISTEMGDSLLLTKKDSSVYHKYFIDKQGQRIYCSTRICRLGCYAN